MRFLFKSKIWVLFVFLPLYTWCCETHKNKRELLTLAYTPIPPHIYSGVNGEATGPVVDFWVNHIAPLMDVQVEFTEMPLARAFKEVQYNRVSGFAFAGISENRKFFYDYPKAQTFSSRAALATKKKMGRSINREGNESVEYRIGYVKSGITTSFLNQVRSSLVLLFGDKVWSRNLQMLLNERVDAIYSPSIINLSLTLLESNQLDAISLIELPDPPLNWFTIFSKSEVNSKSKVLERYNLAMKQSGGPLLYESILSSYIADKELQVLPEYIYPSIFLN